MKLKKDAWTWKNPRFWILAVLLPAFTWIWVDVVRQFRAARGGDAPAAANSPLPLEPSPVVVDEPVAGLPEPLPPEPFAWTRDPFAWQPKQAAVVADTTQPEPGDPDLTAYRPEAILYSPSAGTGLAVIKGERVRPGDALLEGVIVSAVRADHVEVQIERSGRVYRLALRE